MSDTVVGEDGFARCAWAASSPEYRRYHDEEWGRPVGDDDRIYEKLCLEGFQAGLAWITILRKREGFRNAFKGFDAARVARFTQADVERLLDDPGIVRHRAKIEAAITNARATVRLREQGTSLAAVMWAHRPKKTSVPRVLSDIAAATPESKALSAELRKQGFAFVGPTTVYAAMQALGVVNDHLRGCHWREIADAERKQFVIPGS